MFSTAIHRPADCVLFALPAVRCFCLPACACLVLAIFVPRPCVVLVHTRGASVVRVDARKHQRFSCSGSSATGVARPRGAEKVHDACILPYVRFILVRAMPTLHVRVGKERARAHGAALHVCVQCTVSAYTCGVILLGWRLCAQRQNFVPKANTPPCNRCLFASSGRKRRRE